MLLFVKHSKEKKKFKITVHLSPVCIYVVGSTCNFLILIQFFKNSLYL